MTNNNGADHSPSDFKEKAFSELLTSIRLVDTVVQSWIKYLFTVQAGLIVGYSYIIREEIESELILILIPIIGIIISAALIIIICRAYYWQGKFMKRLTDIDKQNLIYTIDDLKGKQESSFCRFFFSFNGYSAAMIRIIGLIIILAWIVVIPIALSNS